jgi:Zn-dependent protease
MNLTPEVLKDIIGKLIILILSVCVHEYGHAFVADRLGDRLPRQQGRVSLNPFAHVDPIGTLALPIVGLLASGGAATGFGWGKPVMVQPNNFSRRFSMRVGHMMVAAAGPTMNVLFGTLIAGILSILIHAGVHMPYWVHEMTLYAIFLNYVLAFFNLLPAPPLDGGAVIMGLLPDRLSRQYAQYQAYGIFVVAAFILIPALQPVFVWPATQVFHGVCSLVGIIG